MTDYFSIIFNSFRAAMILQCVPCKEIILDNIRLPFGTERSLVRAKLGNTHSEQNEERWTENGFIELRKDLYVRRENSGTYFVLHYDEQDLLTELEVTACKKIKLFDIEFNFTDELDLIAEELSNHSPITQQEAGAYVFGALNIYIMNEKSVGGEEEAALGYFSCSSGKTQYISSHT